MRIPGNPRAHSATNRGVTWSSRRSACAADPPSPCRHLPPPDKRCRPSNVGAAPDRRILLHQCRMQTGRPGQMRASGSRCQRLQMARGSAIGIQRTRIRAKLGGLANTVCNFRRQARTCMLINDRCSCAESKVAIYPHRLDTVVKCMEFRSGYRISVYRTSLRPAHASWHARVTSSDLIHKRGAGLMHDQTMREGGEAHLSAWNRAMKAN